jgi:hypothetical protein
MSSKLEAAARKRYEENTLSPRRRTREAPPKPLLAKGPTGDKLSPRRRTMPDRQPKLLAKVAPKIAKPKRLAGVSGPGPVALSPLRKRPVPPPDGPRAMAKRGPVAKLLLRGEQSLKRNKATLVKKLRSAQKSVSEAFGKGSANRRATRERAFIGSKLTGYRP